MGFCPLRVSLLILLSCSLFILVRSFDCFTKVEGKGLKMLTSLMYVSHLRQGHSSTSLFPSFSPPLLYFFFIFVSTREQETRKEEIREIKRRGKYTESLYLPFTGKHYNQQAPIRSYI